jgi:hypothetical protein
MDVDLFAIVEKFFQGTILFALKFCSTLVRVLLRPVDGALTVFRNFQSAETREVGPTTFFALCAAAFWSALLALLLWASEIYQTDVLKAELLALDSSPLRVPIILVGVEVALSLLFIDLLYRAVASVIAYVEPRRDPEEGLGSSSAFGGADGERLRAVGLYTTSVATLMPPLILLLLVVLDQLSSASFLSTEIFRGSEAYIGLGVAFALLTCPAFCAVAVGRFVRKASRRKKSTEMAFWVGTSVYGGTVAAFTGTFFVMMKLFFVVNGEALPVIASLDCLRYDDSALAAIVEIRNTTERPQLIKTAAKSWHIIVDGTLPGRETRFQAEGNRASFDGKNDPTELLIKPRDKAYGIFWFPISEKDRANVRFGWASCEVYSGMHTMSYKKTLVLETLR